jgi:hypothetical protein
MQQGDLNGGIGKGCNNHLARFHVEMQPQSTNSSPSSLFKIIVFACINIKVCLCFLMVIVVRNNF